MPVKLEIIEDGFVLHSINDMSRARNIPKNWWSARQGPGLTHPRSGEMVFFGLAPGIKILVDTILKATRYRRVKVFRCADDAWTYVYKLAARTRAEQTSRAAA